MLKPQMTPSISVPVSPQDFPQSPNVSHVVTPTDSGDKLHHLAVILRDNSTRATQLRQRLERYRVSYLSEVIADLVNLESFYGRHMGQLTSLTGIDVRRDGNLDHIRHQIVERDDVIRNLSMKVNDAERDKAFSQKTLASVFEENAFLKRELNAVKAQAASVAVPSLSRRNIPQGDCNHTLFTLIVDADVAVTEKVARRKSVRTSVLRGHHSDPEDLEEYGELFRLSGGPDTLEALQGNRDVLVVEKVLMNIEKRQTKKRNASVQMTLSVDAINALPPLRRLPLLVGFDDCGVNGRRM
jgi:hypothetical protein